MNDDRIDELESLLAKYQDRLERHREIIEAQQERIDTLERQVADVPGGGVRIDRRTALKAGGLVGLLALGAGTTSADPHGQVGTETNPIRALYTEELNGGLTGGQPMTDLLGPGLTIDGASLAIDAGPGLEFVGGRLTLTEQFVNEPDDLEAVLAGMDQDGDGTYVITNIHELQAMNADPAADYRLDNDIDAIHTALWNDGEGFDPIGPSTSRFAGSFDGGGHTIDGLTIDRPGLSSWGIGLFGITAPGATIANVVLTNVDITGRSLVGGLVGETASGTIEASTVSGAVSGEGTVGGLVGELDATVRDSFAAATVNGDIRVGGLVGTVLSGTVETSFAAGNVSGGDHVGGLVGVNYFTVRDSFAVGSVDGDSAVGGLVGTNDTFSVEGVNDSYATGAVTGTSEVGGLVGIDVDSTVSESYWDVPASGLATSDGGTGIGDLADEPPAEGMVGNDLDPALAEDFDFDDTWETVSESDPDADEDDYPILQAIDRQEQFEARE